MGPRAVSVFLAFALILATMRPGFALPSGPAEPRLESVSAETATFSLPEDQQSRARLEAKSAGQRFRLLRASGASRPTPALRRYAVEVDRQPAFHCRLPVASSVAEDPVPH